MKTIPEDIVAIIKKNWQSYLSRPVEDCLKYAYENDVMIYEFDRRIVGRAINVEREVIGKPLSEALTYLAGLNVPKDISCLNISCDDLVVEYSEYETDREWAGRIYYNVISPIDRQLKEAKKNRKQLLTEKTELQKRIKEIDSLL